MVTYADDAFPSNVYSAAMIDTGGNFVWANQTVAVATTASGKSNATLTEQKNNQLVLAWQDDRSGSSTDLYVQNIDVNDSLGVGIRDG